MANLSIDLNKLKQLPRRLQIIAGVLVLEIAILALGYFILDDLMADRVAQVSQLRGALGQIRRQNERQRHDLDAYPELKRRYDEAMAAGIANPLDRLALIRFANEWADSRRLSDFRYTLSAAEADKTKASSRHIVENDKISFECGALLDTDVVDFMNALIAQQPGHYRVAGFSLERAHEPDEAVLASVRRGGVPALVKAKLDLQWTGIMPNLSRDQ